MDDMFPVWPTILFAVTTAFVLYVVLSWIRSWTGRLALISWMAFTGIMSASGFYQDFSGVPPRQLLLIVPPLICLVWLTFSSTKKGWLEMLPVAGLVGIQVFRVPIEMFLAEMFDAGHAPIEMTFYGYNFDVLTGLFALPVAYFGLVTRRWPIWTVYLFNVLGLMLVLTIAAIGILSTPTVLNAIATKPPNTFIGWFPYSWLPAFLVPLAIVCHVLSIRQLMRQHS